VGHGRLGRHRADAGHDRRAQHVRHRVGTVDVDELPDRRRADERDHVDLLLEEHLVEVRLAPIARKDLDRPVGTDFRDLGTGLPQLGSQQIPRALRLQQEDAAVSQPLPGREGFDQGIGPQLSEADVDLPFYPGTKPVEGQSSRYSTPTGSMVSVQLHTDDAADKVAGFYREQLKAKSAGKQFTEMSGGDDNFSFSLSDEKTQSATQVSVSKAEKGTDVQIMSNRGPQ